MVRKLLEKVGIVIEVWKVDYRRPLGTTVQPVLAWRSRRWSDDDSSIVNVFFEPGQVQGHNQR